MAQLKELLSELNIPIESANIAEEPTDSMNELLAREKKYGLNTRDIVSNKSDQAEIPIPRDIVTSWYNAYLVFKDYGGNDNDINTQLNEPYDDYYKHLTNCSMQDYTLNHDEKQTSFNDRLLSCF